MCILNIALHILNPENYFTALSKRKIDFSNIKKEQMPKTVASRLLRQVSCLNYMFLLPNPKQRMNINSSEG